MGFPPSEVFTEFARGIEPQLRCALIAELGDERGREAAQDALVWAWEHWDQLDRVVNRPGYLYRLAKRRASCRRRPIPVVIDGEYVDPPVLEPGLRKAIGQLSDRQQCVIFLIEGLGMTYQETASFLGVSRSTVQTHRNRGMKRLRRRLGVPGPFAPRCMPYV